MIIFMRKAIIFIDGSNIYFAQKKSGFWLDWVKVKKFFEKQYRVLEYRYYIGLRKNDTGMGKFLNKLQKVKFKLITKLVKVVYDEKGNRFEKANFDVEITADVILLCNKFDTAILFSGDSDFVYLNQQLTKINKDLIIYSTRKTLAWELKLNTKYYYFEEIKDLTKGKNFTKL